MRPIGSRASRLAALVAALFLSLLTSCVGARGSAPVPLRPCIEARANVTPPDPCASLAGPACDARMAFVRRAFDSTVGVHVTRYTAESGVAYAGGTGFVIDENGTVMTAEHVVRDATLVVIYVRRLGGNGRDVIRVRDIIMDVAAADRAHDVAILRPRHATEHLPPALPLRPEPATAEGQRLWHFGNVSFWGSGTVGAVDISYGGLDHVVRADFPCRHGDSGGPFVNEAGEVVGILAQKDGDGEGVGRTYFVPLATALRVLGIDD